MTVQFVDQTLRDGPQSLWGMRINQAMMTPALPHLDRAGYKVIDYSGGAIFKILVKNYKSDPWREMREVTASVRTPMRAAIRSDGITMGPAPDALMDLWVERLVANGLRSFWIFDVLFHRERMTRLVNLAKGFGAEVLGVVFYADSPVHTDDFYRQFTAGVTQLPVDGIYLEDTGGSLTPERARTFVRAVLDGAGERPVEAQFHNTTGMAPACYVEALRAGVRTLHTAVPPLADRGSVPNIELMLKLVAQLGLTADIDTSHVAPVREHFTYVGEREGFELGGPTDYDLDVYKHQIPGGMMGTLKAQLADLGLSHRLEEILQETAIVRQELGYPGMATPLSQFAGIQAALNLLTGERYKQIPIEVIRYVCGYYGKPVGTVDPNVMDRVMSHPLAKAGKGAAIEQPTLAELRRVHGNVSDDELILRATMSSIEVDEMLRAPIVRDYPVPAARLIQRLVANPSLNQALCRADGLSVSLSR
ncbi:MAG: pyruvate carboxylase [Burkholderiaceae bacterium]